MVQLEAPLARALREGTPASHAIRDAAARAGVTLRPAHPTVSDPPLSTWFTADLRDGDVPRALAGYARVFADDDRLDALTLEGGKRHPTPRAGQRPRRRALPHHIRCSGGSGRFVRAITAEDGG